MSEWRIYDEPADHAFVLEHRPTRAKAWFCHNAFRLPIVGNYIGAEDDPFKALAAAIAAGVRPFKTEGNIASLRPPFELPAPLELPAPPELIEGPRA